ncbi:hypothetical protein RDWZM_009816 [Blomia tropicalis]|uniref:Uncharacterized protein n=1 Tax=Blomia tropicalis TaxID=40697 RepID=A0A9Q0M4B6_BLOTA|nr:hypothetical protein RDWZM_009816 [Blomia tropicalis]
MIHETIVLPNLQRIESGLHAFGDAENCGKNSADESENRKIIIDRPISIQLVTYGTNNSGLSINLLFHNVSVNLGHSVTSGGVNSTNPVLPVDYSNYFIKRRALAGAINTMNVMRKNTITAVASAAITGSTSSSTTGAASSTGATSTTVGSIDFSSGANMANYDV